MKTNLVIFFPLFFNMAWGGLHPLSDEYIEMTNKIAVTWQAKKQFPMAKWETVKKLANGSYRSWEFDFPKHKHPGHDENLLSLPDIFDSAEKWPKCQSIKQITTQSGCGSCWAFGAAEAMSDRICIHSNQEQQLYVSAQDLLTCCPECGGCTGGDPLSAWQHWKSSGVTTGGLYNRTDQGCKPYSFPPCKECDSVSETPQCQQKCADPNKNYNDSVTFGKSVYTLEGEKQIMLEIFKNGPVQGGFLVYEDFFNYHRGIYRPTTSFYVGLHSIKIVGWGVENGRKYWKIANSWGEDWGENGFFRMERGINSCDIEEDVVAGMPLLKKQFVATNKYVPLKHIIVFNNLTFVFYH